MGDEALQYGFGKAYYKNDKRIDYEALRLLCTFAYDAPNPEEYRKHIDKGTLCRLTISNKYEANIYSNGLCDLILGHGFKTEDEVNFYGELMFIKYVQPYIDEGFIVPNGQWPKSFEGDKAIMEDVWRLTDKCYAVYNQLKNELDNKRRNEALIKAAEKAGVKITTDGTGKPLEYFDPGTYNIPLIVDEAWGNAAVCGILSFILLFTYYAWAIVLIWIWWIISAIGLRNKHIKAKETQYKNLKNLPKNW